MYLRSTDPSDSPDLLDHQTAMLCLHIQFCQSARRSQNTINKAKSAVAPPSQRKFLGFSFTGGASPKRRISPQAMARFKGCVREMTRTDAGRECRTDRQRAIA